MADILIFGMKMPENEPLRLVLNPNGQLFVDHGVTFTEYEAIELPEHGDLIDRSKLSPSFVCSGTAPMETDFVRRYYVDRMPVVIPSNKEETE